MAPDEEPLRGIVVGLGTMGSHHLRVLSSMPDCAVVAVVDPEDERRSRVARADGAIAQHASLADALERHDADFACIAAPSAVPSRMMPSTVDWPVP